ncbi:MAG: hypothetical protein H0W72_14220 [Planctomycetes bacterium]|nr:hypothetical protein [Planctomycetota bacterium]
MRRTTALFLMVAALFLAGCGEGRPRGVWALRWMERPSSDGPSTRAAPEDVTSFAQVATYDHRRDRERSAALVNDLVEGDVIAYWMSTREARRKLLTGRFSALGYRLLVYGHLAMVVADPERGGTLRLFSSESFTGPNSDEDLASLASHSYDVFRLDRWDRVDTRRLHEFVVLARAKANRWYGYDFSGMFGLWNSPLRPTRPRDIGHDYICSTVVVAALHYAGVALDAVRHGGFADVCTPKQVVTSKGCIVPPPAIVFADLDLREPDVGPKGGRAGR